MFKKLSTTLLSILLVMVTSVFAVKAADEDLLSETEVIIKYKNRSVFNSLEAEENFLNAVGEDYDMWHDDKSAKKRKKHFKKLKRLSKLSSKIAVLELDKKLGKGNLKRLIKKLNHDHYKNNDFEIEAVYPNYLYEIVEDAETNAAPNDPLYKQQWSHDQVSPDKLWKFTKGAGTVVAVIDTGVDYNHPDLADNIWINEDEIPGNGKDDDNNGFVDDYRGWDFVERAGFNCISGEDCRDADNDPSDKNGHGTHISGIIAAVQNNKIGVSGVAPEAKVMPLRAGYSTGSSAFLKTTDILSAITYAINNNADVINMSFAGSKLTVLADILNLAEDLGIVLVAAAGNSNTDRRTFPAALESVIAVGAITYDNEKAHFSNFGDWVDLAAPGAYVLSTMPNNGYDFKSGTSMSAPHVAAVAALIKSKNKLRNLSAREVKDKIIANAIEVDFPVSPDASDSLGGVTADINFSVEVDDISLPSTALLSTKVTMSASASDPNEDIIDYQWSSDLDGSLGSGETIEVNNLSLGTHVITVQAENALGELSEPAFKVINISETKQIAPQNFTDKLRFRIRRGRGRFRAQVSRKSKKLIRAYKWVSNQDGTISNRKRFNHSKLSSGLHRLSLLVQDTEGNWSQPVQRVIKIQ